MTNDQLTRERLEKIKSWRETYGAGSNVMLPAEEAEELARMALATMESGPVGKPFMYGIADPDGNAYIDEFCVSEDLGLVEDTVNELNYDQEEGDELNYSVVALYRHAQQPVVPDDVLDALQNVARIRLDLNDFDGDRRGIADCLGDAEEALIEVVNRRAAMLQGAENTESRCGIQTAPALDSLPKNAESRCGNSPVIPDTWIPVSERMPDCWCRTCRPVVWNDMRFVVCPDCGNKRCPRANDHRNACTGSNEPGQEGSAYQAAPQEPIP